MDTYIMLTRLSAEKLASPKAVESLERDVIHQVRDQCPEVKWLHSYAVLGPYEFLDIFEAPDLDSANKVSTLLRISGHSHVEVWPAIDWDRYKRLLRTISETRDTESAA